MISTHSHMPRKLVSSCLGADLELGGEGHVMLETQKRAPVVGDSCEFVRPNHKPIAPGRELKVIDGEVHWGSDRLHIMTYRYRAMGVMIALG